MHPAAFDTARKQACSHTRAEHTCTTTSLHKNYTHKHTFNHPHCRACARAHAHTYTRTHILSQTHARTNCARISGMMVGGASERRHPFLLINNKQSTALTRRSKCNHAILPLAREPLQSVTITQNDRPQTTRSRPLNCTLVYSSTATLLLASHTHP